MMNIFRLGLIIPAVMAINLPSFGQASVASVAQADSFYFGKDFRNAKLFYERLITDSTRDAGLFNRFAYSLYNLKNYKDAERYFKKALTNNPIGSIKAAGLAGLARISALNNNKEAALDYIDSAIAAGFYRLNELDTSMDFEGIRKEPKFKKLRDQLYNSLYPCANNPKDREFDFWIGEWDVYQSGTKSLVGHSLIQKISGGCAILENWNSPVSEGKSINYIDDSTGKWKQVWVGSYPGGKQNFFNGEYKDGAMRFTYSGKDAQNKAIKGRFIFYNLGTDQVRQFNEYSVDEGKNWITSYDFTYLRKMVK